MERVQSNAKILSAVMFVFVLVSVTGSGGCNSGNAAPPPPPPTISVSVAPASAQTIDQGQTKSFTANVSNDSANKGVTWALTQNGIVCSPACGTIAPSNTLSGAAAGYTAPAAISASLQFAVIATAVADTTKSASTLVTAVPPPMPNNPAQLPTITSGQAYSYTLTESGGVAPFTWSIVSGSLPAGLSLDGSTGVISGTATAAVVRPAAAISANSQPFANSPVSFTVQVQDSGNPQLKAIQALQAMIVAPAITISVSPLTATVSNNQSAPVLFTAEIGNDVSLQGATWALSQAGVPCPTMPIPTCGTLSPTASNAQINYYAPVTIPTPATVMLTATSVADKTKSATATITVAFPAISVAVSPASPTVPLNGSQLFTVAVSNDVQGKGVNWSLAGAGCSGATCGTMVRIGNAVSPAMGLLYIAPGTLPTPPAVTATATSVSDPTKSATATISLSSVPATIGVVSLISANTSDTTGGIGDSFDPVIDNNGSFISFASSATDISPLIITNPAEVFWRSTCIGQASPCTPGTLAVSTQGSGQEGNCASGVPSISSNGLVVGFVSCATDLDLTSTNQVLTNAYLRAMCGLGIPGCIAGAPHMTSVDSLGRANDDVGAASVSPDGRFMSFDGAATLLKGTEYPAGAYTSDSCITGPGSCAPTAIFDATDNSGNPANGASQFPVSSQLVSLTGQGGIVAFESGATNLVSSAVSGRPEIYERDLGLGKTFLISQDNSGAPASQGNFPAISYDGRFISFVSSGLVPSDSNGQSHLYVRDTCLNVNACTPTTTLVDLATAGSQMGMSSYYGVHGYGQHVISSTGRYVVFITLVRDFVPGLAGGPWASHIEVMVRDMSCTVASACEGGGVHVVSVDSAGDFFPVIGGGPSNQANIPSSGLLSWAGISGDGRYVAFVITDGDQDTSRHPGHAQIVLALTGF